METNINNTHDRVISRGSKSLTLSVSNGIAKATLQKNTGEAGVPGETSYLYNRSAAILQSEADRSKTCLVEKFGTVHPKMKAWMRNKGIEMGFVITDNETDGRTLKAERIFNPK